MEARKAIWVPFMFLGITIYLLMTPTISRAFPAAPYWPISSGNSWTYLVGGYQTSTTVVLQGVANINGVDTKVIYFSDGSANYFTNDLNGVRMHAEGFPGNSSTPPYWGSFTPPILLSTTDVRLGVPVYSSGTALANIIGYGNFVFNYTSTVTPQAFELVTVPAGTYNAIRVQWTRSLYGTVYGQPINILDSTTYWFAENLGVVKEIKNGNTFLLTYSNLIDKTPDNFNFTAQKDVALNTLIPSNAITVTGINTPAPISITGGQYSINGGAYTSSTGTVSNGQTVTIRLTSGNDYNVTSTATLTIGGVSGTFSVTTIAPHAVFTPQYLRFMNQAMGGTSSPQTFTLSNNGTAPLSINEINISGDFAQTNSCGPTLAVGQSCSISITFTPTKEGIRKGRIILASDSSASPGGGYLLGIGGLFLPSQTYAIFRTGNWYIDEDRNDAWSGCGLDGCLGAFGGLTIDIPVMGDWDGAGNSRIGIFRQGYWYLDLNGSGTWNGCGTDGCLGPFGGYFLDIPVVGDWNGDGKTKIGIYRQGNWYLDMNANGAWDGCSVDACLGPFGGLDIDLPVVGDWNGNGLTKIGIYRQGLWYLDKDGSGTWGGCGIDDCLGPFGGFSSDVPVTGDWNGEAISRIGIYRFGAWYLDASGNGQWNGCLPTGTDKCVSAFGGLSIDKPVVK